MKDEEMDEIITTNLLLSIWLTKSVLKGMMRTNQGIQLAPLHYNDNKQAESSILVVLLAKLEIQVNQFIVLPNQA
jgi:hypothetical protein